MKPKKNAFGYFVNTLFLVSILYILVCGSWGIGEGREYPYLIRGKFFGLFLGIWVLLNGACALAARLELEDVIRKKRFIANAVEALFAVAILAAAVWMRLATLQNFPVEQDGNAKTYIEIAQLLNRGTLQQEGKGYCSTLALFPKTYGYASFLALVFRIWGDRFAVAQYANLVLAAATVFLTYRTGRLAGGRAAGLSAMLLAAFWPSQVLYVSIVSSEALLSFLMMLGIYLFILSVKACTVEMKHPGFGVLLYIAIGIVLGLCAAVGNVAVVVIAAMILYVFPCKLFLPAEQVEQVSISMMILSKGWLRCLIMVLCYALVASGTATTVRSATNRSVASGTTALGYELMVGLNQTSGGNWNEEDANYLLETFNRTEDADQAHLACRDLAVIRLRQNPRGTADLLLKKMDQLLGDDNYSVAWDVELLQQQGNLTPQREAFLLRAAEWGNLFYLICLAFSAVAAIFLWKKGNDIEFFFILVFVGITAAFLLLEIQNRYHYPALLLLAVLSGSAVDGIYRMNRAKVLKLREEKEARQAVLRERQERIEKKHRDEEELTDLRKKAMQSKFDMKDALERNLIRVTVTEAYRREDKQDEA